MTGRRDLERDLGDLYADAPEVPGHVLKAALEQTATTRQRRYGWLPVVRPPSPGYGRSLLGPVAGVLIVFVFAVVLVGLIAAPPDGDVGPPAASAQPTGSPPPSPGSTGATVIVAADGTGDVATIAEALEIAVDGDTILVRPGTYAGGIAVSSDVVIRGDGPRSEIVVTATASTPTIELEDTLSYGFLTQGTDAAIKDLTLRNAGAASFAPIVAIGGAPTFEGLDAGGTIWLSDASDATVRGNRMAGLAMTGELGDPRISDNVSTETRSEGEAALIEGLSSLQCEPWREQDEPFLFGATAAVRCPAPDADVEQLALFSFPDAASLERYWAWRLSDLGLSESGEARACGDDDALVDDWEHGSLACYLSDDTGNARIRWTDVRDMTYGVLDGASADGAALRGRWQQQVSS